MLAIGFVLAIWPLVLLSFSFFLPAPLVVFGVLTNYHFISLFIAFLLIAYTRHFVVREFSIVQKFGPKHALWVDSSSWSDWAKGRPFEWVVASFDLSDVRLMSQFQSKFLIKFSSDSRTATNYYELVSIAWSQFIVYVHDNLLPGPALWLLFVLWSLNALLVVYLAPLRRFGLLLRGWVLLAFGVFSLSPQAVLFCIGTAYHVLKVLIGLISPKAFEWFQWWVTSIVVDVTNITIEYHFISRKWLSRGGFNPTTRQMGFLPVLTNTVAKLAVVISDLGLPHYIMGGKGTYDSEHVAETLELMREAGWPINVNLAPPSRFGSSSAYADWLISGTDWEQGIHNRKVYIDHALDPLRVKATEWRRTEEFRSKENELTSVARYFKSPRYDYPDLDIEDVWFLVGDIFRHSRITPMNYIIKMWEKKYALGSFMVDPDNPRKKYSRWKFISTMGYSNFKKLWRKTFEIAPLLAPVAHVSVKDEALPPRKWMADKVRTVIGSPLGQYIMSTVWNYSPNHNFQWRTTPIKVGMPLNGYWMDYVYSAHSRCQIHYAGDMSEFDSTLSGNVLKLISAIRKKGFEQHRDRDRIARLIDINYKQVSEQLLNTTSTGDIYRKGTGLTTGHSSTSMDNSVGLVILYLLAWKQITGLSASEFKYYNELSCFGDDHILSVAGNKPAAWNFRSIQGAMSKWGVTNNLEATGPLDKISFLSKYVRTPTPSDLHDFKMAGVPPTRFAVYHDRDKLVGKMVAKVKSQAPQYRVKRLVSYLSLTAHHPDVYQMVHDILVNTRTFKKYIRSPQNPSGIAIPSYKKVVQDWYKPDATFPENFVDEVEEQYHIPDSIMVYGNLSPLDSILGALALFPDFVNPSIFNMGYMSSLQSKLFRHISWPVQLISVANGAAGVAELGFMLRKSVYEFLDPALCVHVDDEVNNSTLLVRHWAFLVWKTLPSFLKLDLPIQAFARKVAQVQFSINGKLFLDSKRWNFQVHDLFVLAILSFIHIPDVFPHITKFVLPDINLLFDQLTFFLQSKFWSALPPNYADVTPHLRNLASDSSLVVSAPTGSGKSTAFVRHVSLTVGHLYNKIIVVEPRSTIVRTIVPFVKGAMELDASGATTGMQLDQGCKVWYVTAQELLLHPSWYEGENSNNLIIVDECHVDEAAYSLVKDAILKCPSHSVFVSATPDFSHFGNTRVIDVPLVSARLYNVHTSNVIRDDVLTKSDFVRHYVADTISMLYTRPRNSVSLVFCTTLAMCRQMSEACHMKNFVLSSGTNLIPDTSAGMVIFCTSVADVGITLPNVDLVVTPDIGFTVTHDLESSHEVYFRLSESDLKQRAGRTGRTNNGSCVIVRLPNARFIQDIATVRSKTSVFDMLSSGIPVDTIAALRPDGLKRLFGLDQLDESRASATFPYCLEQLHLYRSNLQPLLDQRARLLELGTNDGSQPRPIDTYRMGVILDSTKVASSELIRALINVVKHLGLRQTSGKEEAELHSKSILEHSQVLIQNDIKARLPYPDPSLGQWGMRPDNLDAFHASFGRN
uniref:175 kDa protein n=1 Tax=Baoding Fusar tick virus 1 TaxID=2972102 RepID=A0A9E7V1U9_9VIRU|nr:MAG: 175 kDa protein [Baoding Fusar tick virus 1]